LLDDDTVALALALDLEVGKRSPDDGIDGARAAAILGNGKPIASRRLF
jgi:hypothetical protein